MKITQSILVASLALAASAGYGQSFSYSIDPLILLLNPIIIWGTPNGSGFTGHQVLTGNDWYGNGSFVLPVGTNIAAGDPYSIVTFYEDANVFHVTFLADSSKTAALTGADFQTTFGVAENDVYTAIAFDQEGVFTLEGQNLSTNSATAGLLSYFPVYGVSGDTNPFFSFSGGAQTGSSITQAVPEPAAFAVLGLGVIALLRRRSA